MVCLLKYFSWRRTLFISISILFSNIVFQFWISLTVSILAAGQINLMWWGKGDRSFDEMKIDRFIGWVRAWWSDYTCKARVLMQSLGQSPGVTDLAGARSAWPVSFLIPTWNREQVRPNIAIKILRMKDASFIQGVGFWIGGLLLGVGLKSRARSCSFS
jgi:hypothetical protein